MKLKNGNEAPAHVLTATGELIPGYCDGCGSYMQTVKTRRGKIKVCRNAGCPDYTPSPK